MCWCLIDSFSRAQAFPVKGLLPPLCKSAWPPPGGPLPRHLQPAWDWPQPWGCPCSSQLLQGQLGEQVGSFISSSAGTSSPPCSALGWRASVLTPTISRSCSQISCMTLLQQLLMIQPGLPSPALPYLACNGMVLRRQGMSSVQPWLSATARSMPISLIWLSSSWIASWFRLLLRQAAGKPPDQGRTRAPRASPSLTAIAGSSGQNSDMSCVMM